jgi:hypothetical protein
VNVFDDVMGEVAAALVDVDVPDRRRSTPSRRLRAFLAGSPVTVPCGLRHPDVAAARWRSGSVRLSRGSAVWRPRFHGGAPVVFRPADIVPVGWRPVRASERFRWRRGRIVLAYDMADSRVELAVRPRHLTIVGRVLALPLQPS